MKTVLITGGIGSGKSEAARFVASRGYAVYDSDSRAKGLYDSVPGLLDRISEALGCGSLRLEDGSLDRAALASAIFSDPARKAALEALLYPALIEDFLAWRSSQEGPAVFFESAVAGSHPLFEGLFDLVLEVRSDEAVRLERAVRRGVPREDALARMRSQSRASFEADEVIVNDGDLESLHEKIDKFLEKI